MNLLLLLDCEHTDLLRDYRGLEPVLHYCNECGEILPVVATIDDRDQRGPDGKV